MKSTKLDFCNSRMAFLGLSMSETGARKELLISHLKNWSHFTVSSAFWVLLVTYLVANRDRLPIEVQYSSSLEIFGCFSLCGIYIGAAPHKYHILKLMKNIDDICDERRNEFTHEIYSRAEKVVYILHKVILPIDSIFFSFSYFLIFFVIFSASHVLIPYTESDYGNLFHVLYIM